MAVNSGYLGSGHQDLDTAIVAEVRGGVEQLLDVVDDAVQLHVRGHWALTTPEHTQTHTNTLLRLQGG